MPVYCKIINKCVVTPVLLNKDSDLKVTSPDLEMAFLIGIEMLVPLPHKFKKLH